MVHGIQGGALIGHDRSSFGASVDVDIPLPICLEASSNPPVWGISHPSAGSNVTEMIEFETAKVLTDWCTLETDRWPGRDKWRFENDVYTLD